MATIKFPNHAVGRLYTSNKCFLARAVGDVTLPETGDIKLQLDVDGARDLSWMKNGNFDRLTDLKIPHEVVAKEQLLNLSVLRSLKKLTMSYSRVDSDDDCSYLKNLRGLEELRMNWTDTGDRALSNIADLPNLRILDLSKTKVTNGGISYLKRANNLKVLVLWDTKVTAGAFKELAGCHALSDVWLSRSKVDDADVSALASLPALSVLKLAETAIGNSGVAQLKIASKLVDLDLRDTKITDAALKDIEQFPALKSVTISSCRFLTTGAIDVLNSVRPDLVLS